MSSGHLATYARLASAPTPGIMVIITPGQRLSLIIAVKALLFGNPERLRVMIGHPTNGAGVQREHLPSIVLPVIYGLVVAALTIRECSIRRMTLPA